MVPGRKVIPLTLELDALGHVISFQGAMFFPFCSCLLERQDTFHLLFHQYGTCWGGTVEGERWMTLKSSLRRKCSPRVCEHTRHINGAQKTTKHSLKVHKFKEYSSKPC